MKERHNPMPRKYGCTRKMKDGTKVTMPGQWAKRRAEILEEFDFFEYRERSYRPNPFCVSSG